MEEVESKSTLRFPVEEYEHRLTLLRQELSARGVDVYIATVPEHLNYFTGFDPTGIYFYQLFVFTPELDQPILLTHKCEKELARVTGWIDDVRVWQHGEDPINRTIELLGEVGLESGMTVGMELDNWYLKTRNYLEVVDRLPRVSIVDITSVGVGMRSRKSKAEIDYMRRAAEFADLGFQAAVDALHAGVREREVLAAVQSAMATAGSEYPALPIIIGSGPRSGLFHAMPADRVVQDGDPVMMEITGVAARYNSNIVRTVVVGSASDLLRQLHTVAYDAFWCAYDAVRPGTAVGEIDRITREVRREYADFIPSRSGFGMELAYPPVWAGRPDILEGNEEVLEPGLTFSLEPSIAMYQGVTMIYGYNILVTEEGAELLHRTDAELFEVGD